MTEKGVSKLGGHPKATFWAFIVTGWMIAFYESSPVLALHISALAFYVVWAISKEKQ